ncbi:MAG TPA: WecB/TagA/CpsF family glycosyltransferase, partial [Candidatus Dormibacteraeota bacterium]|nr:WecB/TagA/CpsF family glycosyltransferase [Candidatus Dormibacteraeota bacterium]
MLAPASFRVLGVRVHAVQIPEVIETMERWIAARGPARYIAVTGMHGVSEARKNPAFREVLGAADLVVPDGMPLVWIGKMRGHPLRRRVYGPELMLEFCSRTAGRGYRHYFYGAAPGVAAHLAETLRRRCPGLQVAGTFSPPFR